MDIEKRLAALGLTLPAPPTPAGNYVGSVLVDNLLFVGGNVRRLNAEPLGTPARSVARSRSSRPTRWRGAAR